MELGLILFVVGFLVLVFLIFKFIKKIVYAVITLVLLVFLIFGGTIGLVYLDLNNLASQNDFDVNLVLREGENYLIGANIPVVNQEPNIDGISVISDLGALNPDDIEKDDNLFLVEIDKEFYSSILLDNYDLSSYLDEGSTDLEGYDLTITKEEVLDLVGRDSTADDVVDLLLTKNEVVGFERTIATPFLTAFVEGMLAEKGLDVKTTVFLASIVGSFDDESNILVFIEGFKDDQIEITPDRLTFKMVRMLPADMILGFIEEPEG